MKKLLPFFQIMFLLVFTSCIEKQDTVTEQPQFELLLPQPCDTLFFGEKIHFKVDFTDNTGLGSLYTDLHNNFGHHSHGEHESCTMDPVKDPVNPYYNDWIFSLPSDSTKYTLDTVVDLESMLINGVDTLDWDEGDYHFHIYITDKDGYQVFTALDVKILYR